MKFKLHTTRLLACLAATLPLVVMANPILDGLRATAKQENAAFKDFSAAAGEKLYTTVGPKQVSCSTCHTDSPKNTGKHATTSKPIEPMAPVVNPKRFSDTAQVEKWFKRNCTEVLGRECSAKEKGDWLSFMFGQ